MRGADAGSGRLFSYVDLAARAGLERRDIPAYCKAVRLYSPLIFAA